MKFGKQRRLSVLVPVLLLAISGCPFAMADLTVIYDSGKTQSIAPLLKPLLANDSLSAPGSDAKRSTAQPMLGPADLSNLLPASSPGLVAGDSVHGPLDPKVLARLAQGNPQPFFLIGSDALSLQWLATHRDTLKALGAVGMLVQADTEADVRRVAEVAQGLSITLGSATDLAAVLGIHQYPVLITRDGIRQ